jgi:hypothetical protein
MKRRRTVRYIFFYLSPLYLRAERDPDGWTLMGYASYLTLSIFLFPAIMLAGSFFFLSLIRDVYNEIVFCFWGIPI